MTVVRAMKVTKINSDGTLDDHVYPFCTEVILWSTHQQRMTIKGTQDICKSKMCINFERDDVVDIAHLMKHSNGLIMKMNANNMNIFFFIRFQATNGNDTNGMSNDELLFPCDNNVWCEICTHSSCSKCMIISMNLV